MPVHPANWKYNGAESRCFREETYGALAFLCKDLPQSASFAVKAQEILNRADAGGKMKNGCMNNRLWIIRQIVLHSPI